MSANVLQTARVPSRVPVLFLIYCRCSFIKHYFKASVMLVFTRIFNIAVKQFCNKTKAQFQGSISIFFLHPENNDCALILPRVVVDSKRNFSVCSTFTCCMHRIREQGLVKTETILFLGLFIHFTLHTNTISIDTHTHKKRKII